MSRRQARRCGARAKSTGEQCGQFAMNGATVCRMHGGSSPHVRAAAERRLVEAKTHAAVAKYAQPRNDATPSQVLVEELRRAAGYVAWLEERLRDNNTPLTSVEWQMLGAERDRLSRLATDLSRLGIESTMLETKLAEIEGEMAKKWVGTATVLVVDALEALGTEFGWGIKDTRRGLAKQVLLALSTKRAEDNTNPQASEWLERPPATLPDELRAALAAARDRAVESAQRDLMAENVSLRQEVERLRGRVQADGLSTRLALLAADDWEPDPVAVAEQVAAAAMSDPEPVVLEGGEVLAPDEPSARPRRGQSLLDHFAEARRSTGYRGGGR